MTTPPGVATTTITITVCLRCAHALGACPADQESQPDARRRGCRLLRVPRARARARRLHLDLRARRQSRGRDAAGARHRLRTSEGGAGLPRLPAHVHHERESCGRLGHPLHRDRLGAVERVRRDGCADHGHPRGERTRAGRRLRREAGESPRAHDRRDAVPWRRHLHDRGGARPARQGGPGDGRQARRSRRCGGRCSPP